MLLLLVPGLFREAVGLARGRTVCDTVGFTFPIATNQPVRCHWKWARGIAGDRSIQLRHGQDKRTVVVHASLCIL